MKKFKIKFFQKYKESSMIKDALDNLPSGVCYFDERGVPALVNKTMYELMHALTGRDIQDISDFDRIQFSDATFSKGEVWQFQKKSIPQNCNRRMFQHSRIAITSAQADSPISQFRKKLKLKTAAAFSTLFLNWGKKNSYTEIIASNVTELYRKKRELENAAIEQQDLTRRLEEISKNVISITRNEEILAMKMHIHNELGIALAETRQFINSDFAPERKAEYIENHRRVAKKLLGEIGNNDEIDIFSELKTNAKKLGAEIVFEGKLPKSLEGLMTQTVRECLINTIKHGKGDKIFVKASETEKTFSAIITDNGNPPASKIIEGGGLSSIRKNVETMGGTMVLECNPQVVMRITLPLHLLEK